VGDRFGTTAPTTSNSGGYGAETKFKEFYHELIKANDIFGGGVVPTSGNRIRRKSCSKSQSHSRVRMQPSIYHDGEEENFGTTITISQSKRNKYIED
jgi:hypothetical protein